MNRFQYIRQIYDEIIDKVTSSKHEWKKFLVFYSTLYKYKFEDALLIYAQRPDATIVADMYTWNKSVGRYINKGAKAIAVYDENIPYLKLKNLFDVSDTNGKQNSIPKMWEIDNQSKTKLIQNLNKTYNLNCVNIENCINQILNLKVEEAYGDFIKGFEYDLIGTPFEKLPLQNVKMYFKQTIIESTEIVINNRCKINSIQENNKLKVVSHFNTKKLVLRMGNATNIICQDILREIERNVKQIQKENSVSSNNENQRRSDEYEDREQHTGQHRIQGNRRDILSEHTNIEQQGIGRNPAGQIRTDGTELHEGKLSTALQLSMLRGGTHDDDAQSQRGSLRAVGDDSGTVISQRPDTKSDEHYGSDSAQEQATDDSRGNSIIRNNMSGQITQPSNLNSMELPTNGSSIFIVENEVIKSKEIQENESVKNQQDVYIPLGEKIKIKDRDFIIESINEIFNKVQLRDVTFQSDVGFPIFRTESIDFIKSLIQNNQHENQISNVPKQPYYNDKGTNITNITNYKYDEADEIGIGGIKTKFKNNIAAIKILKEIESENRLANPYEQKTLAKYSGFGGMAQAFDETNTNWKKEYDELKMVLNKSEYTSARASTPNAHYTSPIVIQSIYKAIDRFGFLHGNILEPAMGVGNFFSLLPEYMNKSNLYGVELDDITGRIAKQLYPKAHIQIRGFEETDFQDNFFDIAIGNVPFGDYKVYDNKYNKYNLNIHDYFLLKTLDKVKPNGIIAFITSKGTLDKENNSVRKLISEKADLIGAIRLPNTAFKSNANTEVTTDIIFLQKRERILFQEPNWINIGHNDDGIPLNSYYIENPHMLLGKMVSSSNMYGNKNDTALIPLNENGITSDLAKQLDTAIKSLNATMMPYEVTNNKIAKDDINNEYDINDPNTSGKSETIPDIIPADSNVKNFTFTILGDTNNSNQDTIIYYRENNTMKKINVKETTFERIKGLHEIRNTARNIIDIQINGCTDDELKLAQEVLNDKYNEFVSKYGYITSKSNNIAFRDDSDYPLLCSLESIDEDKNIIKADMFSKRTMRPKMIIERADNVTDALYICLNEKGKVDVHYIAELADKSTLDVVTELKGLIFKNPEKSTDINDFEGYETAAEYLSGNVRYKLEIAEICKEEQPELFAENTEALLKVQPKNLEAEEIDIRLGSTWIEPQTIEEFIYELLKTRKYNQNIYGNNKNRAISVNYNEYNCSWFIENKTLESSTVSASESYGTKRISAYHVIEDTLNLKDVVVKDKITTPEGTERYVINKKETMIARSKQDQIKEEFKNWIFKEPKRREKYVNYYNQTFNNIRPREYDGSFLTFANMNPDIKLRKHQVDAIARIVLSGTALLAHTVGAGKSFEMIASAMELKRIGLANKSIIVVPNHITEQMGAEFLKLYPTANILIATKKDFEKNNRKRFISKIATGTYDAIIIGHTQFEKIPISPERQERLLNKQIEQISEGIKELKEQTGDKWNVKQMEKYKKNLLADLKQLIDENKKDDLIEFEQLGIDYMFVESSCRLGYAFNTYRQTCTKFLYLALLRRPQFCFRRPQLSQPER